MLRCSVTRLPGSGALFSNHGFGAAFREPQGVWRARARRCAAWSQLGALSVGSRRRVVAPRTTAALRQPDRQLRPNLPAASTRSLALVRKVSFVASGQTIQDLRSIGLRGHGQAPAHPRAPRHRPRRGRGRHRDRTGAHLQPALASDLKAWYCSPASSNAARSSTS